MIFSEKEILEKCKIEHVHKWTQTVNPTVSMQKFNRLVLIEFERTTTD